MNPTQLILDTDFSSDVDDLGDVALAAVLHKQGLINLRAVVTDVSAEKTPGAIAATLKWFGLTTPLIGAWKGAAFDPGDPGNKAWRDYIYDNYDRNGVGLASAVEDSVAVMRRVLAAAPNNSVVIVSTAPLNNIAALLASEADVESPLSGAALLTQKCRALYACCGIFPTGTEWNVQQHPTSAHAVASGWPSSVPLVWVGIELGSDVITGASFAGKPVGNLLKVGYSYPPASGGLRPAWGQMAVLAAATNEADFGRVRGAALVNVTTGANSFSVAPHGGQVYLTRSRPGAFYQDRLNHLLGVDETASQPVSEWPSTVAPLVVLNDIN